MDRRDFLRSTSLAPFAFGRARAAASISLVADPADRVAASPPAVWATDELEAALSEAGFTVRRRERPDQADKSEPCIVAAGAGSGWAAAALKRTGLSVPDAPESLALADTVGPQGPVVLACGADARGLVYALHEIADRARLAPDTALKIGKPVVQQPASQVRSVMRQFVSETYDKPWYYDREMWTRYLTMLAAHRFNRFHLSFGLGYDTLRQVADTYLLFLYPFLVQVPGYRVRATNLTDAERDRNLETLRFISEQTVARGMDFQLGIWTHGYQWPDSPLAQNTIEGLTAETHAPYCRDALTQILRACPAISSVALRIHGESGVAEGSYDFWKTIFDGVKRCGRRVEIDLHAKGIDAAMIENALATGMPVNVAPKYWAEHLGMPYHQAAIRELEMPVPGRTGAGLMTLSEGARVFTRYGYADLMRDDRRYTIRHRVFSGTQRLLMCGDPAWAAAYSRAFRFCGSAGADLMEPLTCRGRRGTSTAERRSGYADPQWEPRWDWQKYEYWYRVWGRLLYDPETDPEVCRRHFGAGPAARGLESALSQVSRILPIVTTAHLPSAACDAYWPEVYWNQPMAGEPRPNPYSDSPAPRTFQNVSPLDPQLFSRISDFAEEMLKGERSGRYSPLDVAQWLEDLAGRGEQALSQAGRLDSIQFRRLAIDIHMQVGLGRFFAAKLRSGVLLSIHERTGDRHALEEALKAYRLARSFWAQVAERAKGVYAADLSASDKVSNRGQWLDRLPAMDEDIAGLEQRLSSSKVTGEARVEAAIQEALGRGRRETPKCSHRAPAWFEPGRAVTLEVALESARKPASARLYYRHVNQAERYAVAEMEVLGNLFRASIPGEYTGSPYPLQYYFEFKESPENAWLYPGFSQELSGQPYFVLQRRGETRLKMRSAPR